MKLSEKLRYLRKSKNMTQEELGEICNVSRQTVTKWELGSLPDIEKILLLCSIFNVTADVLLRDDLSLDITKTSHCHTKVSANNKMTGIFEGIIIKESLADDSVIDILNVCKIELWKTDDKPKYWTALTFSCLENNLPEYLSHTLKDVSCGELWFADFKKGNVKYVVFHNKVLKYTIGNRSEKEMVLKECKAIGVPENQMQWEE